MCCYPCWRTRAYSCGRTRVEQDLYAREQLDKLEFCIPQQQQVATCDKTNIKKTRTTPKISAQDRCAHKDVKAVSGGTCNWDISQVKKLWDTPLEKQLSIFEEKQHNFLFFYAKIKRITREYLYLEIVNDKSYAQYKWRIYLPKIPRCLDAFKNNERLPVDQNVQCVVRKEYDKIILIAVRFTAQHYNFSLDCLPHVTNTMNEESSLASTNPLNLCQRRIRAL